MIHFNLLRQKVVLASASSKVNSHIYTSLECRIIKRSLNSISQSNYNRTWIKPNRISRSSGNNESFIRWTQQRHYSEELDQLENQNGLDLDILYIL